MRESVPPPSPAARDRSAALWFGYAFVLLLLLVGTLDIEPYDDAYFFKRFAVHALQGHGLAWNVDEGPVYGSTSQLFQAVLVGLTALTRTHTLLLARGFLAFCLVGCFALLLRVTRMRDAGVCAALAATSTVSLYMAISGMETALALALLAALLVICYGPREKASAWPVAPMLTVLIWLARPDALLLALPPLIEHSWRDKRRMLLQVMLLLGCVAALLLTFKLYYGTALPLSFYAKQQLISPYDKEFIVGSRSAQRARFAYFATLGLPLFLLSLLRRDRVNLTLVGAVAVFELYHTTTIDVMGMHGRFYAPAIPLLVLAAARAFDGSAPRLPIVAGFALVSVLLPASLLATRVLPGGDRLEGAPPSYYVHSAVALVLLFAAFVAPRLRTYTAPVLLASASIATLIAYPPRTVTPTSDDRFLELHTHRVTVFRGLDALRSCVGEAIHIYHSEVGVPGLRFLDGKVSDLVGLLSARWLFGAWDFDAKCLADRPEAIFLPHKNYKRLNEEILRGHCIEGYRRVVAVSSSPLYVRSDLVDRYRKCASRRK